MPQEGSGNRVLLNQPFYAAAPHGYLMQRVTALLAFREKGDAVKGLLDPEFKVGEVPFKVQNEAPEAEADVRDRFVIAESQVLIHQAAETLLRLYFAHVDLPGEPWVVLARERDFRKFREKVNELQDRLASGEEDDRLHLVFHSSPNRADLSPEPAKELWDAALETSAPT